jgi:hypothetical protein
MQIMTRCLTVLCVSVVMAAAVLAQPVPGTPGAGERPGRGDSQAPLRHDVWRVLEAQRAQRGPSALPERRLSEQERAELRQQLRQSADHRSHADRQR